MNRDMRLAYGQTLVALGARLRELVVLEADLSLSTMGALFAQAYPDRFFDVGIAEANLIGVAAGLALTGKIPFVSSFAVFATGRCYDQLRASVCIGKENVKIVGSSAGLSDYGDGATHQSVDDLALMRALPNMQVFVPADAVQTRQVVEYMAEHPGPMYLRISRSLLPPVTGAEVPFEPGRLYPLRRGRDCALVACGAMVSAALEAAQALEARGINASVWNAPTLKPLGWKALAGAVQGHGRLVVAEEHSVIGGLADAVALALDGRPQVCMRRVGIPDVFGQSATDGQALMQAYGLTSQAIVRQAAALVKGDGT